MAKRRAGLHREISSIFDGVPIPKSGGSGEAPSKPEPSRSGYDVQKTSNKWRFDTSEPKRSAGPATQTSTPMKPKEPVMPPPRTAPAEQPRVETGPQTGEENLLQRIWQQIESKLLEPKPGVSPARQKMTLILIPALSVTLIFVLLKVFGTAPRGASQTRKDTVVNTASIGVTGINWQIPEPYPTDLRDPTQFRRVRTTTNETEGQTGKLIVSGILFDKDDPSSSSASICNQVVSEGDEILGAKVVRINKSSVEFEKDGQRWTQRVTKE